jgi:20S proteasome alpha/beta subunit
MFGKERHLIVVLFCFLIQEAEELFETISQALLSSVDRDCLSGWGGHVYVV